MFPGAHRESVERALQERAYARDGTAHGPIQGFIGYAPTSVMGPIVLEIFEGPRFASIAGGAVGPYVACAIHDATGSYRPAFIMALVLSVISAIAIWRASPGKVRVVPGKLRRLA